MHMLKTFRDKPVWNQPSQVKTIHMQQNLCMDQIKFKKESNQFYEGRKLTINQVFKVRTLTFFDKIQVPRKARTTLICVPHLNFHANLKNCTNHFTLNLKSP